MQLTKSLEFDVSINFSCASTILCCSRVSQLPPSTALRPTTIFYKIQDNGWSEAIKSEEFHFTAPLIAIQSKTIFCWSSQNLENSQNPNFSPPAPYETGDPVSLSAAGCERAWNSAPPTPTPPFSSHCTQICFFALSVLFRNSGNVSSFQKWDGWIAVTRSWVGFLSWTVMRFF